MQVRIEEFLSRKIRGREVGEYTTWLLVLIYTVILSWYTVLRHFAFKTGAFDLGVFSQALWSTLNGKLFYETPDMFGNPMGSFLGIHFSPILFLLVPLYYVFPAPETLLIFQSFILAVTALPIYWLMRDETGNRTFAIILVATYLLYPPLHCVNCFDFHVEAFLPLFLLLSSYFFAKNKFIPCITVAFLAMLTIDVASAFTALMGISWILMTLIKRGSSPNNIRARLICAASLTTLSMVVFVVAWKVIALFGPQPFTPGTISWFPHLGSSVNEIIFSLFNPQRLLSALSYDSISKAIYWILLFAPLAFFPLLSPLTLLPVLLWFGVSIITDRRAFYHLGWHLPAFIIPFLFTALVYGVKYLSSRRINVMRLLLILLAFTLFNAAFTSPLNQSIQGLEYFGAAYDRPVLTEHESLLHNILSLIPSNASIFTQNNLFPHLSHRFEAYVWLPPNTTVDYILIDLTSPHFLNRIWNITSNEMVTRLLGETSYGEMVSADGILLLKKGYNGERLLYVPIIMRFTHQDLALRDGTLESDPTSKSEIVLTHGREDGDEVTFWFGPYIILPPGEYITTFKMKTESTNMGRIGTIDIVSEIDTVVHASKEIYGRDYPSPDTWQNFTLHFTLTKITSFVEFRGINFHNTCKISLDYIEIKQLSED